MLRPPVPSDPLGRRYPLLEYGLVLGYPRASMSTPSSQVMLNSDSIEIRTGGEADAPQLAAFASRTFEETFGPHNRPEDMHAHLKKAFGVEQQTQELLSPSMVTLLALHGATLVAFAQVQRKEPPAGILIDRPIELHRFYVDRPVHGKGVAQRLMLAVHAATRALHGQNLWLGVWERNPRAIAFYKKVGFVDRGSHEFLVGSDRQTDRVLVAPVQVDRN
jgi:GNAT superfamily N-acetyltransferase